MRIVQSEIGLGRERPRPVYISKQTAVKRTAQRSFALLDDRIDLETGDHLCIFIRLLECLVLLLEFLVDDELVADLSLEVGIFL